MKNAPWQKEMKALGLTQKRLAAIAGRDENSVGRALGGARKNAKAAGPYIALILAWKLMSSDQREEWEKLAMSEEGRSEEAQEAPARM
jgi:hypothetical protein